MMVSISQEDIFLKLIAITTLENWLLQKIMFACEYPFPIPCTKFMYIYAYLIAMLENENFKPG